jgi:hypothetical protein
VCHLLQVIDATEEPSELSSLVSFNVRNLHSRGEDVSNRPRRMMNKVIDFGSLQTLPKISS